MANFAAISIISVLFVNYVAASDKVLFCYYGTWATYRTGWANVEVDSIDPKLCSHLIYSFAGINIDGSINVHDPGLDLPSGRDNYRKFNSLKQQSPELKTILAVGGFNEGSYKFSLVAARSDLRRNFVQTSLKLVLDYGFDGLDMDWEYPNRRDTLHGRLDIDNFTQLLKELREEFDKYGLLLTAAVSAVRSSASLSYDIPAVSKYLDYVSLMTYDMHGAWDPFTGHNAGLHKGEGDDHINRDDAFTVDVAVEYWLKQGCPPEKLVLGLPFYSRTYTLADTRVSNVRAPAIGAGLSGPHTITPGFMGYHEFCQKLQSETWDVRFDDKAKVPYAVQNRNWVSYDDSDSLITKVKYGLNQGLAGMMVWSIETDDFHGHCHGESQYLLKTVNRAMGRYITDSSSTIIVDTTTTTTTTAAPIPTTAPAITTESAPTSEPSVFQCKEAGLTSNPKDCSTFYSCNRDASGNLVPTELPCPNNLLWDDRYKSCNWAYNVDCDV